jgi:coiled-coil domain-containing protein 115
LRQSSKKKKLIYIFRVIEDSGGVNRPNSFRIEKVAILSSSAGVEGSKETVEEKKNVNPTPNVSEEEEDGHNEKSEPKNSAQGDNNSPLSKTGSSSKSLKETRRSNDPISWYGILVPQSLRNAQKSFTSGVEGGVPQLLDVMADMREVELKIYNLRKEIGE